MKGSHGKVMEPFIESEVGGLISLTFLTVSTDTEHILVSKSSISKFTFTKSISYKLPNRLWYVCVVTWWYACCLPGTYRLTIMASEFRERPDPALNVTAFLTGRRDTVI